ncbi:hypothetical protein GQ600_25893 [Phytophthora cactorum]|nr:hypothetical protein GQ600_25893 [Phytophthora cactorum]
MSGHNNNILVDDDDDSRIEARSGNSLLTEFCVEWVSSWLCVHPRAPTKLGELSRRATRRDLARLNSCCCCWNFFHCLDLFPCCASTTGTLLDTSSSTFCCFRTTLSCRLSSDLWEVVLVMENCSSSDSLAAKTVLPSTP